MNISTYYEQRPHSLNKVVPSVEQYCSVVDLVTWNSYESIACYYKTAHSNQSTFICNYYITHAFTEIPGES